MDAEAAFQKFLDLAERIAQETIEIISPIVGDFDTVLIGRLILVLILCGMIGLERSEHERASGFRPHILVGLGACLMAMTGAYAMPETYEIRDPMRIASYVVSGIGFLGGGAILRHGATVRGLTTAASIWGAAGIGIATGVGMGVLAIATTLLILFTLSTLEKVETRLGRGESASDLRLHLNDDHRAVGKALTALDRLDVQVKRATLMPGVGHTAVLKVELNQPLKADEVSRLIRQLLIVKSIARVEVTALEVENGDLLIPIHDENHHDKDRQMEQLNIEDD